MKKKNILICRNCLNRNYHFSLHNRNNNLILRKYCHHCHKHVIHEETR